MNVQEIAAFSDGAVGGNPAGVWLGDQPLGRDHMQAIAAELGHSETAFAVPEGTGWRVRYFSPAMEVPFCGHATVALGAALAMAHGNGVFPLLLNDGEISVEGRDHHGELTAALQSPPTSHTALSDAQLMRYLSLLGYQHDDLSNDLPPALIHAGADHLLLPLSSRAALSRLDYDLEAGARVMREDGLVTVMCVFAESATVFSCRNAFASGGVKEDPATGAAAAAFGGYLRDAKLSTERVLDLKQGDDMGMPSRIRVEFSEVPGSSVRVSGQARVMGATRAVGETLETEA